MKPKILLVDDSSLARRSMRQILEPAGFDIVEADDGMVALERYFLEKPDVVMLDLVMRGMYGLDVLTKLRQLDPHVRVIIVSADVQASSQQLGEQAGACAFITKPPERDRVLSVVRDVLQGTP